jgi:energy-converting hydrogenase A subunit M
VVAADALVDLLQDVLAFLSGDALHEYSRRCAPLIKLVSDEYVGLGMADELLGQILVGGNLLLAEVVDEGLPPVHVDHHDLLASGRMR